MSIKDLFWKETSPKEPSKTTKPSTPIGSATIPMAGNNMGPSPIPLVNPSMPSDSEFMTYLKNIMDKSNLPGPDYYEFLQALENMKAMPLSEQQKFVAVFASFQAQGVTVKLLTDSALQYIEILKDRKAKEFDTAVLGVEQQVQDRQKQIQDLLKKNEELNKTIQQNADKAAALSAEMGEMQSKVTTKKSMFESTFNAFVSTIADNISKIKTYLNANAT